MNDECETRLSLERSVVWLGFRMTIRNFVFLMLAMSGSLLAQSKTIEVHGHRGARAVLPENTLPAFVYAIAEGVDALELDTGVTKDGVVVVSHDPYLAKPVCSGPREKAVIHELTLAEVRQWDCGAIRNPEFPHQQTVPGTRMPTLDEVLSLAPRGNFRFNIETKIFPQYPQLTPPPEEFVRLIVALVKKHRLESRVILQSFDFRTLREMKKQAPAVTLAALYNGPAKNFADIGREAGADMISPEHRLVTPAQVRAAHDAGFAVVPWTVNKPEDWDRLIEAGVDAIITDDPAALIAYLKQRKLR